MTEHICILLSCDSESILRRMRVLCLRVLSEKSMLVLVFVRLLVNLLIAVMNSTYEKNQANVSVGVRPLKLKPVTFHDAWLLLGVP